MANADIIKTKPLNKISADKEETEIVDESVLEEPTELETTSDTKKEPK